MTKVKSINGRGTQPLHCYFWIATITNNSIIPEYDFNKKEINKARDLFVDHIKMFSWYPITLGMLIKIKKEFNEDVKLAINDEVHSLAIDLDNNERLRTHPTWRNDISFLGGKGTTIKYALFKTTDEGIKGYFITEKGEMVKE